MAVLEASWPRETEHKQSDIHDSDIRKVSADRQIHTGVHVCRGQSCACQIDVTVDPIKNDEQTHVMVESCSESSDEDFCSTQISQTSVTDSVTPLSSLLRAVANSQITTFAVFGGQGCDVDLLRELRSTYRTHESLIGRLVNAASGILNQLARDKRFVDQYQREFDLMAWLEDGNCAPEKAQIDAAPISMPLIGLLQFLHYRILGHELGANPADFHQLLAGATGHSQGIVVAAVIASVHNWKHFETRALDAIVVLQAIGARASQVFPIPLQSATLEAENPNEQHPTPMLSVKGLSHEDLQMMVNESNQHLGAARLEISLINGRRAFVVSGPPTALSGLHTRLGALRPNKWMEADKTKKERSFDHHMRFLRMSAPFHSSHMKPAMQLVIRDTQHLTIKASELAIPLYSTADGSDLRHSSDMNIVPYLADLVLVQPLDWQAATKFYGATTVLDFGPGGFAGAGGLIHANKEGTGVRVILASITNGHRSEFGYRDSLINIGTTNDALICHSWARTHTPGLVRTGDGRIIVDTRFSRLLGLPPVMVAGMTPTTAHSDVVIAIMKAGYHVELAAGGFYSSLALTAAVQQISRELGPGRGIAINVIYANPIALRWQISTIAQLCSDGLPIDGLTIGAGVPSLDVAAEYINSLGIRYIGFKPGTATAIQQVLAIAKAHPRFPIVLQWTGGRGGGHHSSEDFHRPLLEMYGRIRDCENISLVVGSGFGDAKDSYPYISGEWSRSFGHADMPCDGILLGSRMLVAREARTSFAAKEAIVAASGIADVEWEKTYQGPAGGVLTVVSEMGEPIHKLATRLVCFWHELDTSLFKLSKKEMTRQLQARRQYIIDKLNKDCHRVWFGKTAAGVASDVDEMTYKELIDRLIHLTFVSHRHRWIHASYQTLAEDVMTMAQSRFTKTAIRVSMDGDPHQRANALYTQYPAMATELVVYNDARRFIEMCRRRGRKPVPFIPVLDENFETWFKKDSLWQSEDLEAVIDQDVGRVCILQGPVAARYSTTTSQSAQEILDDIHNEYVRILSCHPDYDYAVEIPFVECFGFVGSNTKQALIASRVEGSGSSSVTTYDFLNDNVPSLEALLSTLGSSCHGWCRAFFTAVNIVQGRMIRSNPSRTLFQPTTKTFLQVSEDLNYQVSITLFEHNVKLLSEVCRVSTTVDGIIHVELFQHETQKASTPAILHLYYEYQPQCPLAPLCELATGRNDRIKDFYRQMWLTSDESYLGRQKATATFATGPTTVSGDEIVAFAQCVGNHNSSFAWQSTGRITAPMDYAIVLVWKVLVAPLLSTDLDCDLLRLVHLSNCFKLSDGEAPICAGDLVSTTSRVTAIVNQASGKRVRVQAQIIRNARPVITIDSDFFVRGVPDNAPTGFEVLDGPEMEVTMSSNYDVAILMSKNWFRLQPDAPDLRDGRMRFCTKSTLRFDDQGAVNGVSVSGDVLLLKPDFPSVVIGCVAFNDPTARLNPVAAYLAQHGNIAEPALPLPQAIPVAGGAVQIRAPLSNQAYQRVSGDTNPIHTSAALARYAELPGTITHGMHTSAMVRTVVEQKICGNDVGRFREFSATFTDMVLPGDTLDVKFEHTAMRKGHQLITIQATKAGTQQVVLKGQAIIESPQTAFIFTGQGSQSQGMGMDLYEESSAARAVWDHADEYYRSNYGFSILNIVRTNPKELIVRFGGSKGRIIRDSYRRLRFQEQGISKPLFPTITPESTSYRFFHPEGLLNATQFTQPALTLMEKATFEDLSARGLVSEHSSFAGHSLGEYAALCSAGGGALTLDSMIEMVFYRGMSMHMTVKRDIRGHSNYAMCAVDPSRVGAGFNEKTLSLVVQTISEVQGALLEIVNYNIRDTQYVCTGEVRCIACLTHVLDNSSPQGANIGTLLKTSGEEAVRKQVQKLIAQWNSLPEGRSEGRISLKRGRATIPLKGVDVPFHSSFLRPGVDNFREILQDRIQRGNIEPRKLSGRYIPNLTARPFEVTKDYFALTYERTGSKIISRILDQWDELISDGGLRNFLLSTGTG